jgi:hypothetical protein
MKAIEFTTPEEDVPPAFFEALADLYAGRIVNLDTALNEPPPQERN